MYATHALVNGGRLLWPRQEYRSPEEVAAPVIEKLLWQGDPYLNANEVPRIERALWQGDPFLTAEEIPGGYVERVLWQQYQSNL